MNKTPHVAIHIIIGFILMTFIQNTFATPPSFDDQALAAIPQVMETYVEKQETAGVVTCVLTREGILHLGTAGYADYEAKTPMTTETMFWIASMTKPINAVAFMMLEEQGKISIDDPVSKYLPELENLKMKDGSPATTTLLIRHLLSHMGGLPENTGAETRNATRLQDLIDGYVQRPLQFAPGTRWMYSQTGPNTIARIIELLSGERFEDYLDKNLLTPLGMTDTTFYPSEEQFSRLSKVYIPRDGKLTSTTLGFFHGRDVRDRDRVPFANGGLFSTAADYARFMQMILNGGELDGHRYLRPDTIRRMATLETGDDSVFFEGSGWGLGFIVVSKPTRLTESFVPGTFGHAGACGTQSWIDPDQRYGLLLLTQISLGKEVDVQRAFFKSAIQARK